MSLSKHKSPSAAQPAEPTALPSGKEIRSWLLRVGIQSGALLAVFVLGIVLIGVAQRIGWLTTQGNATVVTEQAEVAEQDKANLYVCPMLCAPAVSEPGKCPVCAMELVESTSGGGGSTSVTIDPVARRILGIQTALATAGDVTRTLRSVGRIDFDEERVATIAAYVDGRLEELYADYVGVRVEKGDDLALLYSPKLFSAQMEYLTSRNTPALDALTGGSERLADVARDNLSELGMTAEQIELLEESGEAKKRLRLTSPIGGTVVAKNKVEGDYVKTGEAIFQVVDLSIVWLMLDLYPDDAAAVRFGQQVEAELQSLPGVVYTGRVAFVDPMVNKKTRTVAIRVEMTNFDGKLKPGDFATATLRVPVVQRETVYDPALAGKWISPRHPQIVRDEAGECPICGVDLVPTSQLGYSTDATVTSDVITVPRSAVLMAGDQSVLYVETKPGLFEIRRVTVGSLTDQDAIILSGVEVGEAVAMEGNFLIDSQMQLSGNASLMDPGRSSLEEKTPNPHAGHNH